MTEIKIKFDRELVLKLFNFIFEREIKENHQVSVKRIKACFNALPESYRNVVYVRLTQDASIGAITRITGLCYYRIDVMLERSKFIMNEVARFAPVEVLVGEVAEDIPHSKNSLFVLDLRTTLALKLSSACVSSIDAILAKTKRKEFKRLCGFGVKAVDEIVLAMRNSGYIEWADSLT